MLADIIVGRSSCGGERGRFDMHQHAMVHYGFRRSLRRLLVRFHLVKARSV
ncbi:hypothetical protein U0C82_00055 [Fulvimarina sp. 2208YS6-2-32]|uniref:Uncharacterized protein n=1 Tax=Fulvimarina uroteuthidis TaxID=3098149 RepID=A0ABU5HXN4_9HYPH|nr:hypothetical protein [Fulvimarina sp. 2208YS6-2-32]MDY8107538.1 hypothetical protein [Fulvimarina sp. 2208YS6-2-32]